MTVPTILLGILMFAVATAVLYAWGLGKALDQQQTLERNLLHVCGSRVIRYLKKNGTITQEQVAELIQGITVGQFWSRNKLKIQCGKDFAPKVLHFLTEQQYIVSAEHNIYQLKK